MPEQLLSRRSVLSACGAVLVVALLAGHFLLSAGTAKSIPAPPVASPPNAAVAMQHARVVVDVVGAVRRPGLLALRQGARVADAIARAGGATRAANLTLVNLAAPLVDGQQVVVPARGNAATASGTASPSSGPVSLSTATAEQLDALPGVGPVTAQKILDYRTKHGAFGSVDELDAIPGIGPARIDQLRDLVVP